MSTSKFGALSCQAKAGRRENEYQQIKGDAKKDVTFDF